MPILEWSWEDTERGAWLQQTGSSIFLSPLLVVLGNVGHFKGGQNYKFSQKVSKCEQIDAVVVGVWLLVRGNLSLSAGLVMVGKQRLEWNEDSQASQTF